MVFNSLSFALFLPIVFIGYWFVFSRRLRWQNLFVVLASYVFYGWWDWRFLLLIALTSFCSWGSGLLIAAANNHHPVGGVIFASRIRQKNIPDNRLIHQTYLLNLKQIPYYLPPSRLAFGYGPI